jgi:hypothetical protein
MSHHVRSVQVFDEGASLGGLTMQNVANQADEALRKVRSAVQLGGVWCACGCVLV